MAERPSYQELLRRVNELEEQLIQRSRQHIYQEIVEQAPVLICRFLPYTTITIANRAYWEYFGTTKDEVIGKSYLDFIPEEDRDEIRKLYNSVKIHAPTITYERRAITSKGIRWLKWTGQAIFDSQGRIIAYQSIGEDITERKNIESAQRQSQARLTQLINFLPDATFAIDTQGKVIIWNKAMEELTMVPAEDMLGKGNYEYALPFYGVRRPILINLALEPDRETEESYTYVEYSDDTLFAETFLEINNKFIWGKSSPIRNNTGTIIGAIESVRDITGWKKADMELKASEKRYRDIFENVSDLLYVHDLKGNFIETNLAFKEDYGYTRDELAALRIQDFLQDRFKSEFDDYIKRLIDTGKDEGLASFITKKGQHGVIEYKNSLVCDDTGTPQFVHGSARDITKRKKAEKAQRASEERFRQMAQASPAVFWMVSPDRTKVIYVSPAFEKIYGYTCETLYGQPSLWFEVIHPDDREQVMHLASNHSEQVMDYKYRIIRPDGFIRWIHDKTSPVHDKNGEIVLLTGIMEDITEKKKTEEERRVYETRLNRSQKMEAIGTLAGGIAHDFNNILSSIIGYTELSLDDVPKASTLYANLEEVLKAGDRARDLVRQILMFSRQVEMERRPVRPHLIIKEALKLLRSSIPSTIKIIQDIDSSTDCVYADPTQIHQVIMNLCTNAYQSMIDTGGILNVSLKPFEVSDEFSASHPHLGEGPHFRLSVGDTGCGMDGSILDRIFDPFFTTKEKGTGTGLGLATVHGIVTDLGGAVIASSTPGKGSTFDVYLPRFECDIEYASHEGKDIPRGGEEIILLVDDEEAILHFGKTMLEQLGYEVCTVSSGTEALKLFKSDTGRFNLVITDQMMPGMTGTQLAAEILQTRPELPVILITGYSETLSEEKTITLGIRCYIEKPFSRNTIAEAVFKALHKT